MFRLSERHWAEDYVCDAAGWVWHVMVYLPWFEKWRVINFHSVAVLMRATRLIIKTK